MRILSCVTFFESLLVLLLAATILLQISRRLLVPYPVMLAAAGVLVAFLPGTSYFVIEPNPALALFIAPVIVDAAIDSLAAAATWGLLRLPQNERNSKLFAVESSRHQRLRAAAG